MASHENSESFPSRLEPYARAQCLAAIRGQSLPDPGLLTTLEKAIWSVIRGIRHHIEFANSERVVALCGDAESPHWARARNARLIMSNVVPDSMEAPDQYPYCIWYPDIALEDTYRKVVAKYPDMRYQVARACAVAGYNQLYSELDVLPDVSVAEEARESPKGEDIYKLIMKQYPRYAVMNDYTRCINTHSPHHPAQLNADTAVHSTLDSTHSVDAVHDPYFNITEDGGIDEMSQDEGDDYLQSEEEVLLYSPLPLDLNTMNKNLFILMAAYTGNIDRYARLRRPTMIPGEWTCILRGIYHSPAYAKWWTLQPAPNIGFQFHQAIHARCIMSNDLSRITADTPAHYLPYLIWYPQFPCEVTLRELVRRRPDMTPQVAHTCIVADYRELYDTLDLVQVNPGEEGFGREGRSYLATLYRQAEKLGRKDYLDDLEKKGAKDYLHLADDVILEAAGEESTYHLFGRICSASLFIHPQEFYMEYEGANSNCVDLFVLSPKDMRERASNWSDGWVELYEQEYFPTQ
jgi:hypothetical protein